jgi:hypothetical protein
MSDKKTPKEASQLFHNIIKASVSPKATGATTPKKPTDEEIIEAIKKRFDAKIEKQNGEFILVDDDLTPKHSLVREINEYIQHITKHGI